MVPDARLELATNIAYEAIALPAELIRHGSPVEIRTRNLVFVRDLRYAIAPRDYVGRRCASRTRLCLTTQLPKLVGSRYPNLRYDLRFLPCGGLIENPIRTSSRSRSLLNVYRAFVSFLLTNHLISVCLSRCAEFSSALPIDRV